MYVSVCVCVYASDVVSSVYECFCLYMHMFMCVYLFMYASVYVCLCQWMCLFLGATLLDTVQRK